MDEKQQSALDELAASRPIPGRAWLIPTGLRRASKHDYGNRVTQSMRERASVRDVPIANLHAIQSGVSSAKLRGLIHHPEVFDRPGHKTAGGLDDDLPIVVDYRGKIYLHDGHHRVVAQRMLGRDVVKARVVKIDAPIARWAHDVRPNGSLPKSPSTDSAT